MSWQEHLAQSADRALVDLVDFCRIPSVSTDPDHTDDCRRGAEWVGVEKPAGDGARTRRDRGALLGALAVAPRRS